MLSFFIFINIHIRMLIKASVAKIISSSKVEV
jgi:hypothetical protein